MSRLPDGAGHGAFCLPPAEFTRFMAAVESNKHKVFERARKAGLWEHDDAYAADALVALADRPAGHGDSRDGEPDEDWSFAKVIVRVDAAALDRSEVAPGEVCEVAGGGPLPVADVWRMIGHGAFVAAISTKGTEIHKVVHMGRKATALQRTALEWLSAGECSIEGCTSPARLEIDHVADWATTKVTQLGDLTGPCGHHHGLKTHHGYRFGPLLASGKRRLIPPDEAVEHPPPAAGSDPPATEPSPINDAPTARARTRRDTTPNQGDLFDTG